MYHCAVMDLTVISQSLWSGTYLIIKGSQRTSEINVVQQSTASGPVYPGDSVTFQCTVLSESDNRTCKRDFSVFWFKAGSHRSYPDIIYTDGNRSNECGKRTDIQKSCVHHLSKNISSSDAGTYYCAVVTCEEILFGKGTKLEIEPSARSELYVLVVAITCLVISVIVNIILICYRNPRVWEYKKDGSTSAQTRNDNFTHLPGMSNEDGYDVNYAALNFSGRKGTRGRKAKELKTEDSVYSQVKI
ncbi:signal-regulatory protein beta-2-like [Pholidichthys leucotaenia]